MEEGSVLDPAHPAQEEWEQEGWEQLREEDVGNKEEEVNPSRLLFLDHEDQRRLPNTREQRREMKAVSRAQRRDKSLYSRRKLIPSALRLSKPTISKQSAILRAPAESREPVPEEKQTLMLPVFNIMGGGKFPKNFQIFEKKSVGTKNKNSQRKNYQCGRKCPGGRRSK